MKGFFSLIIVGFAVLLMVGIFYAQQTQQLAQGANAQSLLVQQSLSSEWFMARQAYSQFASDAIASEMETQFNAPFSAGNCPNGEVSMDYASAVAQEWNDVDLFLQQHLDVNCSATFAPQLESDVCSGACNPVGDVTSHQDVFVELTCTKTIDSITHTLAHPFVINKKIELNWDGGNCHARVSDNVQSPSLGEVDHILT